MVLIQPPIIDLNELNQLLNEKLFPLYIEELKKELNSFFFNYYYQAQFQFSTSLVQLELRLAL